MIEVSLGTYEQSVEAALKRMAEQRVIQRIWSHDHTVWKPEPTEITNRLGWLRIAETSKQDIDRLTGLADELRTAGYRRALLLGMGGSSLAPEVFSRTFGPAEGYLDVSVIDSTDPELILSFAEELDFSTTLFIVSTKSGGTVETLSFFKYFYNRTVEAVGAERAGEHFLAITDPGSKLAELAGKYKFRDTFLNDPDIGGRYSALSYFGLVPAALLGIDLTRLLERAIQAACGCGNPDCLDGTTGGAGAGSGSAGSGTAGRSAGQRASGADPCALLGAVLGRLASEKAAGSRRDKLTIFTSPGLESFGDWVEQLIAESTGKEGRGIVPVIGEPLGAAEVYGQDRLFLYLRLAAADDLDAAVGALERASHPVVRIDLRDLYDLGAQFFLWEMAVAVVGHFLGINPFDQPNVESAKVRAREMMSAYAETGALPDDRAEAPEGGVLEEFLSQAEPGDYVCLQAYVKPDDATTALLQQLRTRIRDRYRVATTVGYGPRFLHSTGQLHKGGGGAGLFIQFTNTPGRDAAIPDTAGQEQSAVSFAVLKLAQALGDKQALKDNHRRVIRIHLGTDVPMDLERLLSGFGK
jgi:transaldolase/glucose-6-phosphate isomerase